MSFKSPVWKYFTREENNLKARCKTCNKLIKISGNTTNYWNHLALHQINRPAATEQSGQDARSTVNNSDPDDPDDPDEVESACNDGPGFSTACTHASRARQKRRRSPSPPPHSIRSVKQLTLEQTEGRAKSFADGGERCAILNDAFIYMLSKDHLPLNTSEKKGFQYFAKKSIPLWTAPSRKKVTSLIEKKFFSMHEVVSKDLSEVEGMTLTFDTWTCPHSLTSYLGGTVHFLNKDFEMETCTLSVWELTSSHTSQHLAKEIEEMLDFWKIRKSSVSLVITDNAANITNAVHEVFGASKCAPCFDHTLNLIPSYILKKKPVSKGGGEYVPGAIELIGKVKKIVSHFHQSSNASSRLKKLQLERGKTEGTALRLIQEVETRWSSSHQMLVRFLELAPTVNEILMDNETVEMLRGNELKTLRVFVEVLKPFAAATEEMSADRVTTASKVIPLVSLIRQKVSGVAVPPGDLLGERLKKFVLSELERRFNEIESTASRFAKATMLDPRFKKLLFKNGIAVANTVTALSNEMKEHFETEDAAAREQLISHGDRAAAADPDDLWNIHTQAAAQQVVLHSEDTAGGLPIELRQYLNRPVVDRQMNPFKAWEVMKGEYPHLYQLALKYLPALSVSVPTERLFSEAKHIMNDYRSRLTPQHLKMLLFTSSVSTKVWESV